MTEDPRDEQRAAGDASAEELSEDEIHPDELEGESAAAVADDLDEPVVDAPEDGEGAGGSETDDWDEDEITFDELDVETAGYFEVSAVGGAPRANPTPEPPPEEQELFEVEAAPGSPEPPPDPHIPPPTSEPQDAVTGTPESIRRLQDVEVEVIATLGTTRMQIRDILGLHVGSVVELHKVVGEPVEVTLNGRLIARGEVVVVDEKFAVRVNEIAGNDS